MGLYAIHHALAYTSIFCCHRDTFSKRLPSSDVFSPTHLKRQVRAWDASSRVSNLV